MGEKNKEMLKLHSEKRLRPVFFGAGVIYGDLKRKGG